MHYKKYSDTVGELFDDIKVQPNHHYSLHIPQQMTAWGPLAGVSEFADEMHKSMMTRGCRLQRMMEKSEFHQLTQPLDDEQDLKPRRLKSIRLTESRYQLLFNLVARNNRDVVNRNIFQYQRAVGLCLDWLNRYGLVQQCYQYDNHLSERKEFMLVSRITNLYPKRTEPIPTRPFRYLLFLFGVVVGKVESSEEAIDPSQVISLAAYHLLDKNTFSISENGIALIPRGYDAFLNISGQSEQ
ncbi:hypothetical protein MJO29_001039 [Puccinia striiformis f. sp. tritici]|nr:hypothetical protein MJO29_001039 [Puccinia striiformis f. sp. tritici]